jgi:hypothetical protein
MVVGEQPRVSVMMATGASLVSSSWDKKFSQLLPLPLFKRR